MASILPGSLRCSAQPILADLLLVAFMLAIVGLMYTDRRARDRSLAEIASDTEDLVAEKNGILRYRVPTQQTSTVQRPGEQRGGAMPLSGDIRTIEQAEQAVVVLQAIQQDTGGDPAAPVER